MGRAPLAAIVLAILGLGAPAWGGTLTITYAFDGGTIRGLPDFGFPVDTVTGGTAVFAMPAAGPGTPSVFTFGTLQQLTVFGADNGIRFLSPASHYLSPVGTALFITFAGAPSIQTGTALSNTLGPGGSWFANLALSAGTIAFDLTRYLGYSAYASVSATGQEVSRVFVPEPGSSGLALAALGVAGAGLLLAHRRRQR